MKIMKTAMQYDPVPLTIFFYILNMLHIYVCISSSTGKMIFQKYCNLFGVKPNKNVNWITEKNDFFDKLCKLDICKWDNLNILYYNLRALDISFPKMYNLFSSDEHLVFYHNDLILY